MIAVEIEVLWLCCVGKIARRGYVEFGGALLAGCTMVADRVFGCKILVGFLDLVGTAPYGIPLCLV